MGRLKIRQLTPRALSALILMILSITGILFWVSYRFVRPFPPNTLMMATGREGGSYAIFGERYRQVLAREGVRLEFHPSSGAVENLRLLRMNPNGWMRASSRVKSVKLRKHRILFLSAI